MKRISLTLMVLITIYYAISSWLLLNKIPKDMINHQPVAGSYRSDEFIFLRTFYLTGQGNNYYQSFRNSVENDARGSRLTKDIFTWRLPTLTYIWMLFVNSGSDIGKLFIIASSISLFAIYKIASKFTVPPIALLSPLFLVPYLNDAFGYQTSFLFTEWWGLFFFIYAVASVIYKKMPIAFFFFVLSASVRELFLIPILFMTLISFLAGKNRFLFSKILLALAVVFSIHYVNIQLQRVPSSSRPLLSRVHNFSWFQFQREISFSMRRYPLLQVRLPLLLFLSAFCSLIIKTKVQIKDHNSLLNYGYLLASFFPLAVLTPFFGVYYNDYWGITFMPLAISFSPFILSLL